MDSDKNKEKKGLKSQIFVFILAMVSTGLWGSAFPSIKIGYRLFDIASNDTGMQILFAGCRFALAGILVIIFGSLIQRRILIPQRKNLSSIAIVSIFQTVLQYSCFYISLAHISGVRGSILGSTSAFFCMIIAVYIFKTEQASLKKFIGCIISIVGVVYFYADGSLFAGSVSFQGEGVMLLSQIGYATSSSLIHIFSKKENPVTISGWQFFMGGIMLQIFGLALGGRYSLPSIAAFGILVYLAFLSAVAYTVWGVLLAHNDVSRVSVYSFMTPIFGAVLSAIILSEKSELGIRAIMALLIISVGILIVNGSFGKSEKKES